MVELADMNPFNGIERDWRALGLGFSKCLVRIHSMELKVSHSVSHDLSFGVNPFNGIESVALAPDRFKQILRESIQWN